MHSVDIDEAQLRFRELVESLSSGDGLIIISRGDQPVAILSAAHAPTHSLRALVPSSVGSILRPLSRDDDLLEEMRTE